MRRVSVPIIVPTLRFLVTTATFLFFLSCGLLSRGLCSSRGLRIAGDPIGGTGAVVGRSTNGDWGHTRPFVHAKDELREEAYQYCFTVSTLWPPRILVLT